MIPNTRRRPIRNRTLAWALLALSLNGLAAGAWAKKGAYAADPSNFEMVEAPTAYTLLHGGYSVLLRMYEGGGVIVKGDIGFHRYFQFGFSGNATNVVGQGHIEVQEPRLSIKVKPLSQGRRCPVAMAVGWDDRGYGVSVDRRFYPGLQKGLYAVVSREFKEAGYLQLHAGANVVRPGSHYDSQRDLGAFGGMSFALSHTISLTAEVDKLFTDFWQVNSGVLFNLGESVRLGMDLREMNRSESFTRLLRLEYLGFF